MRKNDKIIAILGVVILIISSIGIFTFQQETQLVQAGEIDDVFEISGTLINVPDSIIASDTSPFYPLIATPVAVNYDESEERSVIPLYVMNSSEPSDAVRRIRSSQLSQYSFNEHIIPDNTDPKNISLEFAEQFWEQTNAALIISMDQRGYELGVLATPIASYLSIPVIVTDEIDADVVQTLREIGVTHTIICGEPLTGYGKEIHLKSVDEVMDATIAITKEKFGTIDYISLTNPIDAFPPEVLDVTEFYFGPETVKSASMIRQSTMGYALSSFRSGFITNWEFTIPEDYKYALIEFEGYNHEIDGVEEFSDYAEFSINPIDKEATWNYIKTTSGMAKIDRAGNIIEDSVYLEKVFYDCGGDTFHLTAGGSWALLDEGRVSSRVTVKKLDNPVYEMMGGLSSLAPYLTAYYNGIVFGRTDFAFTADDDIITDEGTTSPGYFIAGRNIDLVPLSNKHIIDNIHEPLNNLLAELADIPYGQAVDLKHLTDYYKNNPVHIALVGGVTAIPRYIYENEVGPIEYVGFQGFAGGGTPTDNIYGNIDPVKYDYSNIFSDIYSTTGHPYIENIVGRITGWDTQDANALILRSLFYEDIIEGLNEWKNNFGNLFGGGIDFRAPWLVMLLNKIPILGRVLQNYFSSNLLNLAVPPWKVDTGYSEIYSGAIEYEVGKKLGFNVETALHEEAMLDGFSDEAIEQLKTATLWNRLTYSPSQIREYAGEGNTQGREILENSNLIWLTGHGSTYNLGLEGSDLVASGTSLFGLNIWQRIYKNIISPYFMAGFWGPGSGHKSIGEYYTRLTSTLEMEPSVLWLESCFCGKITGVTPQANVGQGILRAGPASMVASTCGANIAGGYLPGKPALADTWIGTQLRLREWRQKAEDNIYPDFHLGTKIFADMTSHLADGLSVGESLRNARNQYLPEDEDWELWWSPPLDTEAPEPALGWDTHMGPKYSSFNMYQLYGDPGFKPYIPEN